MTHTSTHRIHVGTHTCHSTQHDGPEEPQQATGKSITVTSHTRTVAAHTYQLADALSLADTFNMQQQDCSQDYMVYLWYPGCWCWCAAGTASEHRRALQQGPGQDESHMYWGGNSSMPDRVRTALGSTLTCVLAEAVEGTAHAGHTAVHLMHRLGQCHIVQHSKGGTKYIPGVSSP